MRHLILAVLIALASPALAAPTSCPEHFASGQAPDITGPQAPVLRLQELCYASYGAMDSAQTRTPLWSAEHLTRAGVEEARSLERRNAFHPEMSVQIGDRAELADYARSGFDRGHMAPSGDMPTEDAQAESFSLGNMIPQNPANNRGLWEEIESAVRDMAEQRGELYVVTGPIFPAGLSQRINGRVSVPRQIFKVVYDPATHTASAYLVDNAEGDSYDVVPVSEIERLAGIDALPGVPAAIKASASDLPQPGHRGVREPVAMISEPPAEEVPPAAFHKQCHAGIPCGNACISADKVCRK